MTYSRVDRTWSRTSGSVEVVATDRAHKCPYANCKWSFDYKSELERHIERVHKKGAAAVAAGAVAAAAGHLAGGFG